MESEYIIWAQMIQMNTHKHTFQSRETSLEPFLNVCFTRLQKAGAADGAEGWKEWKMLQNNLTVVQQKM